MKSRSDHEHDLAKSALEVVRLTVIQTQSRHIVTAESQAQIPSHRLHFVRASSVHAA